MFENRKKPCCVKQALSIHLTSQNLAILFAGGLSFEREGHAIKFVNISLQC